MAELIVNVWAGGKGYGPDFGPLPDELAGEFPPEVFAASQSDESAPTAPAEAAPAPQDPETTSDDESAPVDDLDNAPKERLITIAADEGVDIDGRWGEERLRSTIRQRRADQ